MPDEQLAVRFERDRETKTKVRYEPADGEPVVGALYLNRDAAAKLGQPRRLTVTLAPAPELAVAPAPAPSSEASPLPPAA